MERVEIGGIREGKGIGETRIETYSAVTANAVRALYSRQTMMPASLCHVVRVQVWPSVQLRFQVRREKPRTQRTVSAPLMYKLYLGDRLRKV